MVVLEPGGCEQALACENDIGEILQGVIHFDPLVFPVGGIFFQGRKAGAGRGIRTPANKGDECVAIRYTDAHFRHLLGVRQFAEADFDIG